MGFSRVGGVSAQRVVEEADNAPLAIGRMGAQDGRVSGVGQLPQRDGGAADVA
jgi:hypothetical protein